MIKISAFHLPMKAVTAVLFVAWSLSGQSAADALDEGVAADPLLSTVGDALNAYEIDVVHNLNARDVARGRVSRPRLGRFPDLPMNSLPNSTELNAWESEFTASAISGLALLRNYSLSDENSEQFLAQWLQSDATERIFVTYVQSDSEVAEKVATVADAYGYSVLSLSSVDMSVAGNLYATAAQRLAIDSREARRYRSEVTEISYLGERVRRNSNSLFREDNDDRLARYEPSIFLKETLGDEFTQSTIREIIVPGGVALGETAELPLALAELRYYSDRFFLVDEQGEEWALPNLDVLILKSLFDFVERSELLESDAIVDIDEDRRVRISDALRDTDVGFDILHADTMPFEYVPNLPVTKSVVIDTGVEWDFRDSGELMFETKYEVRFLSADNMRIAQTRVALEYEYSSASQESEYQESWGRDIGRLRENLDYTGLGNSMEKVAHYAGWIALLRKLREDEVSFLLGRYEFMKVDKTGQTTPTRY